MSFRGYAWLVMIIVCAAFWCGVGYLVWSWL